MSANSSIEWTDATWNPIIATMRDSGKRGWHCEKISPACDHCYAAAMNKRSDGLVGIGTGLNYAPDSRAKVDISIHEKTLLAPLRWRKPRKIFVCSMTDLFGEWDDGCFYYAKRSASEFQPRIELNDAALSQIVEWEAAHR